MSQSTDKKKKKNFLYNTKEELTLHAMALPALAALFVFSYLPMFGIVIAFKKLNVAKGILGSDWVGFKNFQFLFASTDAWNITRNTVGYNIVFILLNTTLAMTLAILINELYSTRLAKVLQTIYIMPHFLSMAVVSIIVFAFLSARNGYLNGILQDLFGKQPVNWYNDRTWWPLFFVIIHAWKGVGYSSVVYLAAITGISKEYYEAAIIDGASKVQQIRYITLPHLRTMMAILLLMAVGGIFRGDFGLFYLVPQNSGVLYPVTDVIDTYVYRAMTMLNNPGMAAAAGLYQSLVGFVLIITVNRIVSKIDPESALF
ncbi:MAG: ABC transporter permease [Caldicoprobacterales bacterium]|jgi:putative aldouronate transport system permease protein|nr:sugar ABC transporter permease [Clostridiales bacterium]